MIDIIGELGKLTGTNHALLLDHVRRVNLLVAVLIGMEVQHEGDKRPLKSGSHAS